MATINAVPGAAPTDIPSEVTKPKTSDLADQDTFLRLLVAQLANQDPLNPAEGTEWISQLAEFSSLEQLTEIKDGIQALLNKQN